MIVLIVNAIAILSEDRFLARSTYPPNLPCPLPGLSADGGASVGWAAQQPEPAFGAGGVGGDMSIKGKIVNLISATRLLTRSEWLRCVLLREVVGRANGC